MNDVLTARIQGEIAAILERAPICHAPFNDSEKLDIIKALAMLSAVGDSSGLPFRDLWTLNFHVVEASCLKREEADYRDLMKRCCDDSA